MLGLRLSKYLEVLFEHYEQLDVIPPSPNLSAVIAAMESAATDAAAVYAAGNDFDNILLLQGKTVSTACRPSAPNGACAE